MDDDVVKVVVGFAIIGAGVTILILGMVYMFSSDMDGIHCYGYNPHGELVCDSYYNTFIFMIAAIPGALIFLGMKVMTMSNRFF